MRNEALGQIVDHAGAIDPAAGARALGLLSPGSEQNRGISHVIRQWAQSDPEAAADWSLEALRGSARDRALSCIINVVAEGNREMAFSLLDELPNRAYRTQAMTTVARAWTKVQPDAAVAWVEDLEGADRLPAETALIETWVSVDPAKAAHYAAALPEGRASGTYLTAAARQWSSVDPQAAVAWASSLAGTHGRGALVEAVSGWASGDPVAAANYVSGIEDSAVRQELVPKVVQSWNRADLAAAAAWVEDRLPEAATRTDAYDALASAWLGTDRGAASEWMGSMPGGPDRDAAVKVLVRHVSASDPAAAAAWAATVSDQELRGELLKQVGN